MILEAFHEPLFSAVRTGFACLSPAQWRRRRRLRAPERSTTNHHGPRCPLAPGGRSFRGGVYVPWPASAGIQRLSPEDRRGIAIDLIEKGVDVGRGLDEIVSVELGVAIRPVQSPLAA
jgi:hypothetical protein